MGQRHCSSGRWGSQTQPGHILLVPCMDLLDGKLQKHLCAEKSMANAAGPQVSSCTCRGCWAVTLSFLSSWKDLHACKDKFTCTEKSLYIKMKEICKESNWLNTDKSLSLKPCDGHKWPFLPARQMFHVFSALCALTHFLSIPLSIP